MGCYIKKQGVCEYCGNIYFGYGIKFCSLICRNKGQIFTHTFESKAKISASRMGDKNWSKRPEVRKKNSESKKGKPHYGQRGRKNFWCTGSKSNLWKGGITPEHKKIRKSGEIVAWRRSVFDRDRYTCLLCGQIGGKLNAHHIKSFSRFPSLRFDVDNGQTLCVKCHRKTDSYLNRWH